MEFKSFEHHKLQYIHLHCSGEEPEISWISPNPARLDSFQLYYKVSILIQDSAVIHFSNSKQENPVFRYLLYRNLFCLLIFCCLALYPHWYFNAFSVICVCLPSCCFITCKLLFFLNLKRRDTIRPRGWSPSAACQKPWRHVSEPLQVQNQRWKYSDLLLE